MYSTNIAIYYRQKRRPRAGQLGGPASRCLGGTFSACTLHHRFQPVYSTNIAIYYRRPLRLQLVPGLVHGNQSEEGREDIPGAGTNQQGPVPPPPFTYDKYD
eukprot:1192839-Prorocentrum_minimum.AAC.4